jgi:Rieske Fe-S protein
MLDGVARADGYTTIGKLADFKAGDYSRVVLPDGTALYVERSPEDPSSVVALSSICTHRGCAVLWVSSDKEFKCPCHSGKYDKDGINIAGPPKSPLKKLDAKVVNGDVQVSQ